MSFRNRILATLPRVREVETQAWGSVFVRQITGADFPAFWAILEGPEGIERLAKLAILGVCDKDANPQLQEGDEKLLLQGPVEPLSEVANAFLELNGVDVLEKKPLIPSPSSTTRLESDSESPIPLRAFERSRHESC